jgi:hypothetical protein
MLSNLRVESEVTVVTTPPLVPFLDFLSRNYLQEKRGANLGG